MNKDRNRRWLHAEVGAYFKAARIKAGVTQLEIAGHLKVTPQYICNYESGAAGFGNELVRAFVTYYKMSSNAVVDDISKLHKKYLEAEIKGSTIKKAKKLS